MYGIFGRGITKHTVKYGAYIRFWPTLHVIHIYDEGTVASRCYRQREKVCWQVVLAKGKGVLAGGASKGKRCAGRWY